MTAKYEYFDPVSEHPPSPSSSLPSSWLPLSLSSSPTTPSSSPSPFLPQPYRLPLPPLHDQVVPPIRKWKGKERDLFSRGRSSKLEQSGFPTKPLISNDLKAFVEIPVSPRRKNRASVAEAGTSQVDRLTDHGAFIFLAFQATNLPHHTPTTSSTGSSIDDNDEFSSESDSSLYYEFDEESRASRPRLSHRNTANSSIEPTPVLSPNVHRIAKKFFRNTFEVIGPDLSNKDPLEQENPTEYISHPGIPGTMKWGKKLAVEEDKVFYKTITMDGELYKAGDVVMVKPARTIEKAGRAITRASPRSLRMEMQTGSGMCSL
ncbi:hypothetical protein DFJ43DRAFT_1149960 [Lentinula guzmanii]|uniref:Uncharacterized protein n=1 Tax=Lentinula guzmanii TaxID=2804957 RepID=A0AA38N459_9AGAR|nr:hypothetical protein DFJ43DRAFT_1149960 [Lentinula guzmanii]